jgi:hypothetical protein
MNHYSEYLPCAWRRHCVFYIAALALACCSQTTAATRSISEPETLLYGRVVNRSDGSSRVLTQGKLQWTVTDSDGVVMTLSADLSPIGGGHFSYRLPIPHTAVALGVPVGDRTIPFGGAASSVLHSSVFVDGQAARLVWPGDVSVDLSAANRAAAIRVDLEISIAESDLDGDGMPDWWEEANGLDSVSADDASLDPDGDGLSNLQEFLAGSDPARDSKQPVLITAEAFVYADGVSGILLEVDDADSLPGQVMFTLESIPAWGELRLRNAVEDPVNPDRLLSAGDEFSLAAVEGGRLTYSHDGLVEYRSDAFQIQVRDEDPAHDTSSSEVAVSIYLPGLGDLDAAPDQFADLLPGSGGTAGRQLSSFLLGRDHGFVIWELSGAIRPIELALPTAALEVDDYEEHSAKYGVERPQLVVGGAADDILSGGMAGDIIYGGGGDDRLSGSGGADWFAWADAADGHDLVLDFAPGEGDTLVLSDLFRTSGLLEDHLRLVADGADLLIEIGLIGNGIDYTDLSIRLVGRSTGEMTLRSLVHTGALLVGELELPTQVTITKISDASENGPQSGFFRIQRDGSVDAPLSVNLTVAGAATNGVDFSHISDRVTIPAGEAQLDIEIAPFRDTLAEPSEVVEVALRSGDDYVLDASASSAQVLITDLLPLLSLEIVRANAYRDGGQPALILLRREGLVERSLFVALRFSGTATRGSDYTAAEFVNLGAGDTTALIEIQPQPGGEFPHGAESVLLELVEDPNFLVHKATWAEVVIATEEDSFALWVERNLDGNEGELDDLGALDPGAIGLSNLERYAFQLDADKPFTDSANLPVPTLGSDGHLHVEFYRAAEARDLVFDLEVSSDLVSWRPGSGVFERDPAPWEAARPGRTTYRSTLPSEPSDPIFVRVRVLRKLP